MYSALVWLFPPLCVYTRSSARQRWSSALSCLIAPSLQHRPASRTPSAGSTATTTTVAAIIVANTSHRFIENSLRRRVRKDPPYVRSRLPQNFRHHLSDPSSLSAGDAPKAGPRAEIRIRRTEGYLVERVEQLTPHLQPESIASRKLEIS